MSVGLVHSRTWFRTTAPAMGSTAELLIDGPPSLMPHAIARLDELEQVWSRFRPDSELNRLHEQSSRWVHVSHELFTAFRWCQRLHAETDGRFDPTVRGALEQWGYDRTFRDIDTRRTAPTTCPAPGLAGLELRRQDEAVRLAPGMRIDLGGIGKGLAADLLSAELLSHGAVGAYVCLGGDIAVAGIPPDEGWDVPLVHPATDQELATHVVHRGALVMSTVCQRRWRLADGTEAHHLIDPASGAPCTSDLLAVAVAAASAARAEGLAKAALIAGTERGAALLRAAAVDAWLVSDEGVITVEADR